VQPKASTTTPQAGSKCTHEQQTGSTRAPQQQIRISIKQDKHFKQETFAHMRKKGEKTSKTGNEEQATPQRTPTRMQGLRDKGQR
jgi:hypothetical protein